MARKKQPASDFERDRQLDRAAAAIMRARGISFSDSYLIALEQRDAEEKAAARAAARPPADEPGDLFK